MPKRDYKKRHLMKAIVEKRKDKFEVMIYKSVKAKEQNIENKELLSIVSGLLYVDQTNGMMLYESV